MEQDEIVEGIRRYPRWHYQFDLQGHLTPVDDPSRVNRHEQRRRFFFDPLVKHLGGSLAGRRILDLGCNAGFWSLAAVHAGASNVVGIDGRPMHIDQANFVFESSGIEQERYKFLVGNVLELDLAALGQFDLVLCLGLLYHVRHPILLLEKIAACNNDLLIIDTSISSLEGAFFEIKEESTNDFRNSVDSNVVLYPTKQAISLLVGHLGYRAVMLSPEMDDYSGAEDYRDGRRVAFWCSKATSLPVGGDQESN